MTEEEARIISNIILHVLMQGSKNTKTGNFETEIGKLILEIDPKGIDALRVWAKRLTEEGKQ